MLYLLLMTTSESERFEPFPSTHWSEVLRAGQHTPEGGTKALESLLIRYQPALKAHLVARFHLNSDQAMDILQEFVLAKVLEKNLIGRANQARGRFRTFLVSSLDNFVLGLKRRELAQKRSPGDLLLPIDEVAESDIAPATSFDFDSFDLAWAREVVSEALRRMQKQCLESGHSDTWGVFDGRVLGPILEGTVPHPYSEIVGRYGFQLPAQAFNALATGKRMFARALRSVIAEYAEDETEIETEIRELRAILMHQRS